MKIILLTLFVSSVIFADAQPVLTRNNYFSAGDSCLIYSKFDSSLVNVSTGASGPNVQWDFSTLDFNHPFLRVDTLYYISPVGTPYYPTSLQADYSQSNLCYVYQTNPFDPFDDDYNYLFVDNDSVSFIGHWAVSGTELFEDHCTDFIRELSFPFTYPAAYVDSIHRYYYDMSGSDDHYVSGTLTVTADGYGTMITPDGNTLQNVIKIHSVEATRDSNLLFGVTNHVRHYYQWFSSDLKGYILRLEMSGNDSTLVTAAYYQKQSNVATGVYHPESQNVIGVYPNPNHGIFTLKSTTETLSGSIYIYNSLGERVWSFNSNGDAEKIQIDLSDLSSGIYWLKADNMNGYLPVKIVISD
jgi:hypothetical protein